MDYSKLSDSDLMALYNNDYSKLSDEGLEYLYNNKLPIEKTKTSPKPKANVLSKDGIKGGLIGGLKGGISAFGTDTGKGFLQGISSLGVGLGKNIGNPIREKLGKAPLTDEQMDEVYGFLDDKPTSIPQHLGKFGGEIAPALLLPEVKAFQGAGTLAKLGNTGLTGAYQGTVIGGAESLKNKGISKDLLPDTLTGGIIGGGIPAVGQGVTTISKPVLKAGDWVFKRAFPVSPKTVEQLIKPNSKALDLTEDTAQNLLMDTTERIQQDYQSLLNKAGQDVNYAALRLPEDKGVWASSLKDSLDDIYAGYSTSGIKELNPAHNVAGDIYEDIVNQIDAGSNIKDVGKVNAKNLNDIMGNIKNYNINWDNSNAKTRQEILKQIYGDYSRRLGNLSPELRKANKAYSKLAQFDDNEGVRRILNPPKKGDIDSASTALRNYNSTITKGNTNRNIQDLENILVQNGKQPFLNDIDDVNAANELLKTVVNGFNPLGIVDKYKDFVVKPMLLGARKFNQISPQMVKFAEKVSPEVRRILTPALIQGIYGD